MMWRALFIAMAICFAPALASAESISGLFNEANAAFARGDYTTASRDFTTLTELGVNDADVEFNLATTEARLHHYGVAVLHFERALRERPNDEGARAGRTATLSALAKERAEHEGEATVELRPPLVRAIAGQLRTDTWAMWFAFFDATLFAALVALFFIRREGIRVALGIVASISLIFGLASGVGLVEDAELFANGAASGIVLRATELREAPDLRARTIGRGAEGERVTVLETHGNFRHIRVVNGKEAWVAMRDVEPVANTR